MEIVDLVAIGVGVAVLAVAGALVPALLEVRRAARSLDRFLSAAGERLPGLAARAESLLDETDGLVSETRGRLDRLERAAGELRAPLAGLAGAAAGLRHAAEVLLSRGAGRERGASRLPPR
jgi:hypothetical protein